MFGYISPDEKELSREEYGVYRGYYCGLCHALKSKVGNKGPFLLAHDMTFLALILSGLYEPKERYHSERCFIHPIGKKTIVESEIVQYVADMNLLLSYYNLIDNYNDEHAIVSKSFADSIKEDVNAICAKYPRQTNAMMDALSKLEEAEHCKEENLSLVANFSGMMLSEIFAYKDDIWAEDLRKIGFYIGKFIYLMDAYEDINRDRKKQNYNPLLYSDMSDKNCFETSFRQLLETQLMECTEKFERMPILKNANIVRNVLYKGMWKKYNKLYRKRNAGLDEPEIKTV